MHRLGIEGIDGARRSLPVARHEVAAADAAGAQTLILGPVARIGLADLERGATSSKPRAMLRPAAAMRLARSEGPHVGEFR